MWLTQAIFSSTRTGRESCETLSAWRSDMDTPVVVSFIGQKGGVGKSTLARALAVVAASGKLRVQLIDLDFGQQTAARWAQARRSKREQVQVKSAAYASVDEAL